MSAPQTDRKITLSDSADVGVRQPADEVEALYQQQRIMQWDAIARRMAKRRGWSGAYHRRLEELYRFFVPSGMRVLEIGCAEGNLLAALHPAVGVGVDFSAEMIERAKSKHPHLRFVHAEAHSLSFDEEFDIIILSDLVNDLWDVQRVFQQVARISKPQTRLILNFYNRLWELPLRAARALGLANQTLLQNWLTVEDVSALLALADFEVIRHREEVLLPLPIPLLSKFANRYLVKLWPFKVAALTHLMVARPSRREWIAGKKPTVSIMIPARNEAGNIPNIFARTPELGAGTELIFVEGGSTDETYFAIEQSIAKHPERHCQLVRQEGKGKGDAVRLGFQHASGDVLMILDSDLTVAPEDLPIFLEVLVSGKADFVNGSRLVYLMDKEAMRFLNLLGNKFFSLAFSWLLGQPLKDTLCGTKVLWKSDYQAIARNRNYFGDFDPFGDFDLLFGAAKLNLKIIDLPVRYRDRVYGSSNIQRWKHGWLLLRMVMFSAKKIKFI